MGAALKRVALLPYPQHVACLSKTLLDRQISMDRGSSNLHASPPTRKASSRSLGLGLMKGTAPAPRRPALFYFRLSERGSDPVSANSFGRLAPWR